MKISELINSKRNAASPVNNIVGGVLNFKFLNKAFQLAVLIPSLALATGCKAKVNEACIDPSKITDNLCTMEYMPVCGCDGKTYGNSCQAENSGVLKWEAGECR